VSTSVLPRSRVDPARRPTPMLAAASASIAQVLTDIGSSEGGLSTAEAPRRLATFGPNAVREHRERVRYGRLRTNIGDIATLDDGVNTTARRTGKTIIRVRP
jgi:hypothetical protein